MQLNLFQSYFDRGHGLQMDFGGRELKAKVQFWAEPCVQ